MIIYWMKTFTVDNIGDGQKWLGGGKVTVKYRRQY